MELIERVTDNIYQINLGYVKSFVLKTKKDSLILVDTGMPNNAIKIKLALSSANLEISKIKYILLTHSHLDHIGSLYDMKQLTGAMVGINEKGLPYLSKIRYPVGHDPKSIAFSMMIRLMSIRAKLKPVKVDMLLKEGSVPEEFGINMKILETPGHTDDSLSFYLPDEKAVLVGDLLMGTKDGLVFPSFYENKEQMIESVKKIKALGDTLIVVSHGINWPSSKIKV